MFAAVLVCEDCFEMASSLMERSKKELSDLLILQKEMIRVKLVKGEFRVGVKENKELYKMDLMQNIQKLGDTYAKRKKQEDQ